MIPDPQRTAQLFTYLSRAIWLLIAWTFGSLVGQLILYARGAAGV